MNNLMLSFAGAELSELRKLVNAVDKEIALVAGRAAAEGRESRTGLDIAWSRLVAMLDLGDEPEMRQCPNCGSQCMLGATRCGNCWSALPPLKKQTLVA